MNSGNTLIELIGLVLLFGPFPIVYITRDHQDAIVFVFAAIGAMILMTYISAWLLLLFLPLAWWHALKPYIKRSFERKKPY